MSIHWSAELIHPKEKFTLKDAFDQKRGEALYVCTFDTDCLVEKCSTKRRSVNILANRQYPPGVPTASPVRVNWSSWETYEQYICAVENVINEYIDSFPDKCKGEVCWDDSDRPDRWLQHWIVQRCIIKDELTPDELEAVADLPVHIIAGRETRNAISTPVGPVIPVVDGIKTAVRQLAQGTDFKITWCYGLLPIGPALEKALDLGMCVEDSSIKRVTDMLERELPTDRSQWSDYQLDIAFLESGGDRLNLECSLRRVVRETGSDSD